jgi:hypothetical protein
MPRVSSSIVVALERARDCSEVFARAIQCGESLAQPPQRGKKTWESGQGLSKPVDTGGYVSGMSQGLMARLIRQRGLR